MTFVGVDLGTTNSAICSYDGETVRLYKSPEQHDVTPSAIFMIREEISTLARVRITTQHAIQTMLRYSSSV
jgi:molecular chaperone DnaK (HSP70)